MEGRGTLPYNISHDGFDVTVYLPPKQTETCENITLLQLRVQGVNIPIFSKLWKRLRQQRNMFHNCCPWYFVTTQKEDSVLN